MTSRDVFSGCHPAVNFLYFALVILFSMCWMHPACLALSLFCAVCYNVSLRGWRALRFQLVFSLPMALMATAVNALFNHRGVTILAYLPSGNPLTLESLLYGVAAAVMLCAVVTWFGCWNAVMTSDKLLYLFGKGAPALSLILSMALGFVPRFKRQLRAVAQAQRCIGRGPGEGTLSQRFHSAVTILSVMLTWSLERSIVTADSMRSRGYGLPGRTAYSLYRFDSRDGGLLVWLLGCGFFLLSGWAAGEFRWRYFPALTPPEVTPMTARLFAAYLALCLTPLILRGKEALTWRRLHCAM